MKFDSNWLDTAVPEGYELLITLAQIPAPSGKEEKRAAFCHDWLLKAGAEGVYIDQAQNVIYPLGDRGNNPLAVIMAHSDVVFPDETPLPLRVEDGKIHCPGVGDDTANAVAVMMAAKYVAQNKLIPGETGLLLVVNSCEEGLGNLRGTRALMDCYGDRITEFISLDGGRNSIVDEAVGSHRYKIEVETEGGHSFGAFGNRNAIAYLASLIDTLYTMKVPDMGRTTFNVGTISGGTSVNTIAQHAEMLYEYRSDVAEALEIMKKHLMAAVEFYRAKGVEVKVTLLGDRPCSGEVDPLAKQALFNRTAAILNRHFGVEPGHSSGSTDCNIPLSLGIPAVCLGGFRGSGVHTREEYLEIDSIPEGIGLALDLVLQYFE